MKHISKPVYDKKMASLSERLAKITEDAKAIRSPRAVELGSYFPDVCVAATEKFSNWDCPYDSLEVAVAEAATSIRVCRVTGFFKRKFEYITDDKLFTKDERFHVLRKLCSLYPTGYDDNLTKKLVAFLTEELEHTGIFDNYELRYGVEESTHNLHVRYVEHVIANGRIVREAKVAKVNMKLVPKPAHMHAVKKIGTLGNRALALLEKDDWHRDGKYPAFCTERLTLIENALGEYESAIKNLVNPEKSLCAY